ncbi:MAG: NAD/NADP octopine/nopaline dehydrogenase [Peptococcaceae bacterium]|nr:NAD/NADP octopine/nopaline dehydrogenase [Peptococcaceae bacterium]
MKVAVLGGGNGAQAMAAELSLCGHQVNLCEAPQFEESIAAVKVFGGMTLIGRTAVAKNTGFAKLNMVTTDVKEAIKGVDIIQVVVPAFGQMPFIEAFAPALEDGQLIVFNPGNFGALQCYKYLKDQWIEKDIIIAEAECLVYACNIVGPARVWIKAIKEKVSLAAMPAKNTEKALTKLGHLYPNYYGAEHVFYTSMNNINFILHPATTLLNASRIEQMGPYKNQYYDITPSIARVMERVDEEKNDIARELGLTPLMTVDILNRYYGATGANMYEVVRDVYSYATQTSPESLKNRYVTEDVPFGLVTLASIAKQLGTRHYALETLINLASLLNDEDYWSTGRTAADLGLDNMTASEMIKYVTQG